MPNKLIHEKSPYLLQHAQNPVNWYPWGDEAFKKAKKDDKPIFLSIGYSTCHWCHVMERESFEDGEVADVLNKNFVSIKVDREERPDIDAVYMKVCMALSGRGGWPLTVIMTYDKKPLYTATYIPKSTKFGMAGLMELLPAIADLWKNKKHELIKSGDEIIKALKEKGPTNGLTPSKDILHKGVRVLSSMFDREYGGFGSAPKFPSPHNLIFLMRYSHLENDKNALKMAKKNLEGMYRGGIFDHIGGGFSRYSTDKMWLVPHFEKMLYDNALLAYAYSEAYQLTKNELYKTVAERTVEYVLRELTDENSAFHCGQDADSDGVEGKYYTLEPGEVKALLGNSDGKWFCENYGITEKGNFEGKSIPNLLKRSADMERSIRERLYEYRRNRAALHTDDKVLTSWNALMIAALSKAGRVFGNRDFIAAAERNYRFIKKNLMRGDYRLYVRWRMGEAAGEGKLDDHAFLSWGLIELYQSTHNALYLADASALADIMHRHFHDAENSGYFLNAEDDEKLIFRPKETFDGAMPSGNSAAAEVFIRLYYFTGDEKWRDYADLQFEFLAGEAAEYPAAHTFALAAMMNVLYPAKQLVYVGENIPESEINERYSPLLSVMVKNSENEGILEKIAPFTKSYKIKDTPLYYLCENGACGAPTDIINI